ncbi:hypothetical protein GCM10009765_75760 [Fodinicola feengrottensis]|uniref:SCP domain-containing protein n=1 Tax=Fodinicola feengrottensis TaxID=435914 RepID=A0ABN2J1T9_9ACTN
MTTAVSVTPAQAATTGDYVNQVVTLTNQNRRAHGCPNLTLNATLTKVAQQHSADMAAHNYFSHNTQSGRDPGARITAAGYRWHRWAENIAAGFPTPAKVVSGWMASTGHRANILNCSLRDIGVGYVQTTHATYPTYWTQDFGTH